MADKKLIKQLIELNNQYYKDFVIDYKDGILREHNIKVYEKIIKGFIRGNKVLFEQATGTGKTYLALKFLHDHAKGKRVLFVSPTNAIQNSFVETYKKLLGEDFDCELDTCLYQGIKGKQKKQYDIIIFDEVHRMGAKTWGPNAKTLMNNNPSASILGMTATLERPDGVDVTKFFDGKKPVSRITLVQALERGILPKPNYTLAKVDFDDDNEYIDTCIKDFKARLKEAEGEEKEQILEFLERLKKAKQAISESEDIPQIFQSEFNSDQLKQGKFIVFCPAGEDEEETAESRHKMKSIMKQASKWFAGIEGVRKIKKYSVYSKLDSKKNAQIIKAFEDDDSKSLKLLFSINMLNEGLHVDDIDGVIMLRSTGSRIIYLQQLGRALSVGHRQQPKIFDFVANLNYVDIEALQQMVREVNNTSSTHSYPTSDEDGFDTNLEFKLNVDNLNILELINTLKQNIFDFNHRNDYDFNDFYQRLLNYQKSYGDCLVPERFNCTDGYPLGQRVQSIRKGTITLNDDEKEELDKLGFVYAINGVDEDNIRLALKRFIDEYNDFVATHNRAPSRSPKGKTPSELSYEKKLKGKKERWINDKTLTGLERDYLLTHLLTPTIRPVIQKLIEDYNEFIGIHHRIPVSKPKNDSEEENRNETNLWQRKRKWINDASLNANERNILITNGLMRENENIREAVENFVLEYFAFVEENNREPSENKPLGKTEIEKKAEISLATRKSIYTRIKNLNVDEIPFMKEKGFELKEEYTDTVSLAVKKYVEDYNKFISTYQRAPRSHPTDRSEEENKNEQSIYSRHLIYSKTENLNADEQKYISENLLKLAIASIRPKIKNFIARYLEFKNKYNREPERSPKHSDPDEIKKEYNLYKGKQNLEKAQDLNTDEIRFLTEHGLNLQYATTVVSSLIQ